MMKYFAINGGFDPELTDRFIEFVNSMEDKATIFLDSQGGEVPCARLICYVINTNPERFKIVANGMVCSSALWLLLAAKCEKEVLEDVTGLYHLPGITARVAANGKHSNEFERFNFEEMEKTVDAELDFCLNAGFTMSEMRDFKAGKDVFFSSKRILQLITKENGI